MILLHIKHKLHSDFLFFYFPWCKYATNLLIFSGGGTACTGQGYTNDLDCDCGTGNLVSGFGVSWQNNWIMSHQSYQKWFMYIKA